VIPAPRRALARLGRDDRLFSIARFELSALKFFLEHCEAFAGEKLPADCHGLKARLQIFVRLADGALAAELHVAKIFIDFSHTTLPARRWPTGRDQSQSFIGKPTPLFGEPLALFALELAARGSCKLAPFARETLVRRDYVHENSLARRASFNVPLKNERPRTIRRFTYDQMPIRRLRSKKNRSGTPTGLKITIAITRQHQVGRWWRKGKEVRSEP